MRIVHVITRLIIGGAQENTILCCQDLIEQFGDDVLLVAGPSLGPEGSLVADAEQRHIPMALVESLRRSIHPWRDAKSYGEIKRRVRHFKPDVVHTHSAKAGVLGRYAAASLGVPAIIHTVHGAPFHPYQSALARGFFRFCERQAAGRCHKMVSVADAMTDLMVEAGVANRAKFVTVYSGMDVEPFLHSGQTRSGVRAELGYQDQHVVVGKVARLFHLKGHADVIQAARSVIDQQPNVRFLFVGDGMLQSALLADIRRSGLQDYFQFTGLVSPQRVAQLVGAMDVVVHASLREGLARVLPQALIAGRPVISYDVDGAREVVEQGVTGYLIPPRAVDQLSEAIHTLVVDPAARIRMGDEGRRRFRDVFRHQTMTESLRTLYQQVLDGD